MRDKVTFAALAIAYSVAGFAALRAAGDAGIPVASWDGFALAVAAVMLAARGVQWRRRLAFASAALGGAVALEALAALVQMRSLAASAAWSEPISFALSLVYPGLVIAWPLVLMVFFVGRDPSSMWQRSPSTP